MVKTTTPPAVAPATARPIVFLNPNVLVQAVHVGFVSTTQSTPYQPGGVSMRDEPAEALAHLVTDAGALLVCTEAPFGGYDAKQFMLDRGVRGDAMGPEWFAERDATGRKLAIASWLKRHGNPPAVVIDRPEAIPDSQGGKLVTLGVTSGASLAMLHAREVARLLKA